MAQRVSYSSLRSLSPTLAIIKICSVQYKISMNLQALLHATVMVQTSVLQGDTHPFVATVCDAFIWVDFFSGLLLLCLPGFYFFTTGLGAKRFERLAFQLDKNFSLPFLEFKIP